MPKTSTKRPNVVSFIRETRRAGKSDDQIRVDLLDAGWQIDIINHALEKDPILQTAKAPTRTHFTKYSDWYTQKLFVYSVLAGLILVVLLSVFA